MNKAFTQLKEFVYSVNPKTRKRVIWTLAIIFILQLYFVRELIAAELLFGLIFVSIFSLAAVCYLLGIAGERSLDWAEIGVRVIAMTARKSYSAIEEFSKKPFRHPHSESAQ
jgi:hypothetical protein